MEPELVSVKLDMVRENSSLVEITYRAPIEFHGIELMGVDAGLSWLKNQSINLKMEGSEDDVGNYIAILDVKDSCEFRARGYDAEGDRWEAGLSNHRIERNKDGTITFSTELDSDLYYFKGSAPTNLDPSIDHAKFRIENIEVQDVPLFQSLVDLSVWIDKLLDNPLSEEYIYPISGILRHLKRKSRQIESQKIDNLVRPVLKILFDIYISALEFHEEDVRFLTGEWQKKGYVDLIKDLPDKVQELENDTEIGIGPDTGDRFKELLKFVS